MQEAHGDPSEQQVGIDNVLVVAPRSNAYCEIGW